MISTYVRQRAKTDSEESSHPHHFTVAGVLRTYWRPHTSVGGRPTEPERWDREGREHRPAGRGAGVRHELFMRDILRESTRQRVLYCRQLRQHLRAGLQRLRRRSKQWL